MIGTLLLAEDKRLIAGRAAGAVIMIDSVALPMLAASRTTSLHVWLAVATSVSLLAAVLTGASLMYVTSPRRQMSVALVVQILGGPCDGKRLTLPAGHAVPSQLFVRHPGVHCARRSRYIRVLTTDAAVRFHYAQLA